MRQSAFLKMGNKNVVILTVSLGDEGACRAGMGFYLLTA